MTEQEALEMGIKLRLAFPKMNDEQNRVLVRTFDAYDVCDVAEAIEAHMLRFDFVNPKALVDQIDLNARKHSKTAENRLAQEKEAANQRYIERKAEFDRIALEHGKQDALIAELNDEELQSMKEMAIANWQTDENTKVFMLTKDARKSRLLKGMIYAAMQVKGVT